MYIDIVAYYLAVKGDTGVRWAIVKKSLIPIIIVATVLVVSIVQSVLLYYFVVSQLIKILVLSVQMELFIKIVFFVLTIGLPVLVGVRVLRQRIQEIRSAEEDDISKY